MVKRADGLASFTASAANSSSAANVLQLQAADGAAEDGEKQDASRAERSKKSVYIYIATLFLVVLLFTLLSYFVQQRNNSEISTLHEKNATAQLNIENLQSDNLQLQAENDAAKILITELQGQIAVLEKQMEDIRQQWQAEVKNITENDRAVYNALLEQYNALVEMNEVQGD